MPQMTPIKNPKFLKQIHVYQLNYHKICMEQETEQYLSQLAVQAYSVITFRHNYHG